MVANLRAAAEHFRDAPERLWAGLRTVLDDENLLRELACRSSFHPNGFVKIVLHPEVSPRVRLHVWPSGMRERLVNPHGHRWAFASWVITGSLRETSYAENREGRVFDVWGYAGTDGSHLRPLRACRLALQSTTRRGPGQVYARHSHEVHDAHPADDGMVASLVMQGPAVGLHAPVYQLPGTSALLQNTPIAPDELRVLLLKITDILQPVA